MGVRIIQSDEEGDSHGAVLYCSVTDWAFGPIFEDRDEAESFLKWLDPTDARTLSDGEMENKVAEFREHVKEIEKQLEEEETDETV